MGIKENFQKTKDMSGNFNIEALTKEVINTFNTRVYNNMLWFFDGKGYISDNLGLQRRISRYIHTPSYVDKELMHQLLKYSPREQNNVKFPVNTLNGYYIYPTKITQENDKFTPFQINAEYNPEAYDKNVDDMLNTLCNGREDLRTFAEEILGHILMTHSFPHKVIFLIGETGCNGKSTFLEMVTNWLGNNCINLSLESFNDNTSISKLNGKLANLGDDIDAQYVEKSKNFKTLASGNTISVRTVYSNETTTIKSCATLIFTANEMPVFKDKTGGIARRIIVFPCLAKIKNIDPEIDSKLSTDNARSYITNLAIEGLNRIVSNGNQFSKSKYIDKASQSYLLDSDSVLSFLRDYDIINKLTIDVYSDYLNYCDENSFDEVSKNMFSRRLSTLNYKTHPKTIDKKTQTVYIKKKD